VTFSATVEIFWPSPQNGEPSPCIYIYIYIYLYIQEQEGPFESQNHVTTNIKANLFATVGWAACEAQIKVEATLRLTVSQSVWIGVGHPFNPMTRLYFFVLLPENCFVLRLGALSLTRGRVCNLYCLVCDDWVRFPLLLTTRSEYFGSIHTRLNTGFWHIEVEVTLQLTASQSVCQGIEPTLGLVTWYYFLSEGCVLKAAFWSVWGALSDERSGLSFVLHSL
jgi:hypothetical protein